MFSEDFGFIGSHLIEITAFMQNYPEIQTKASILLEVKNSIDLRGIVYEPEWLSKLGD